MKLEICANSYQSAVNAEKAGAHRIELCSELSIGGITPSYALLKKIATEITIPVNVLIRPRSGDFCYSDVEFELMKENIKICKEFGFNGIVSGILNNNNSIDIKKTAALIHLSKPLSFTFHRAFDSVENPIFALQQLIDLQVDTILTSGQKEKAVQGINLLKNLKEIAENKITILPGSGINANNVYLFKNAGFKEVHTSASSIISNKKSVFFGHNTQTISDATNIKSILNAINNA